MFFISTAENCFWTRWFWCLLVLLPFFSSISNTFPFEDFFHPEKQKKVARDEIVWVGRVGHRGHAVFGQKLLSTQCGMGMCARRSPVMKWANGLKESSKNSHWSRMQPLTTMPAGALIQMGSSNIHLPRGACTMRTHPPEDNSGFWGGPCIYAVHICRW